MNNKQDFFELLRSNDKEKIKEFVLENGKEGKVFCPISFEKEEGNTDDKDK